MILTHERILNIFATTSIRSLKVDGTFFKTILKNSLQIDYLTLLNVGIFNLRSIFICIIHIYSNNSILHLILQLQFIYYSLFSFNNVTENRLSKKHHARHRICLFLKTNVLSLCSISKLDLIDNLVMSFL